MIHIKPGLLNQKDLFQRFITGPQVMIVTNEQVGAYYLDTLKSTLSDYQIDVVYLPGTEASKNLQTVQSIYDALIENTHHRDTTLIALGGGVITDMVGFAAATYQRGVNYINVPTTLLAQVDAAVGGKTGVNHPKAKNMIGAFYQAKAVMIDPNTLLTLPENEYFAGFAEVIKYALIQDKALFAWIVANVDKLVEKDIDVLCYVIERACEIKAAIVAIDERDHGKRRLLNFGHTFAHGIESALNYNISHGASVSIGMCLATDYSVRCSYISANIAKKLKSLLSQFNLPTTLPENIEISSILSAIKLDKKIENNSVRLIALKDEGNAFVEDDVDEMLLLQILNDHKE